VDEFQDLCETKLDGRWSERDLTMTQLEQLAEQALRLAPDDRAYLADLLTQSLPPDGFADAEIAGAWTTEIDRRIAAYDRGETQAIPVDASLQQARDLLASRRKDSSGS
jgi:putative addiction module component (TIGR02574 family)